MAYINGNTPKFSYLTDGDGFPTAIKYRYWEPYIESYFYNDEDRKSSGLRTIEEETFENPNFFSMRGNTNFKVRFADFYDTSNWHNARTGSFVQGKVNFIPLTAKEATKVYWLYRGVEIECSPSNLTARTYNTKANITVETMYDAGYSQNNNGYTPANKIWKIAPAGARFSTINSSGFDSDEQVWKRYNHPFSERTTDYDASSSVSYSGSVYTSFNQLVRLPKRGALDDYGFEALFDFECGASGGADGWPHFSDQRGNYGMGCEVTLGSMFYIPEDETDSYYSYSKTIYRPQKVDIHGVPMILAKSQHRRGDGAFSGNHYTIDVNIRDVLYEKV